MVLWQVARRQGRWSARPGRHVTLAVAGLAGHGLGGNYLPISQLFSLEARQDLAVMQPVRNLQSILHNPPITN